MAPVSKRRGLQMVSTRIQCDFHSEGVRLQRSMVHRVTINTLFQIVHSVYSAILPFKKVNYYNSN